MAMYDDFGSYSGYNRYDHQEYERELERKKKREKERNKVLGGRSRNIKKIEDNDYEEFAFKLQMLDKKWRIINTFYNNGVWYAICEEMVIKNKILELKG